ncbi:MAG: hypothetical protein Q6J44_07795 [Gloeomargarita sp. DG02_4_bins_56]
MPTPIYSFADGSHLEYDHGKFDAWCIYLVDSGGRRAPRDSEYFARLHQLGTLYGHNRLYNDFIQIYEVTDGVLNPLVLRSIALLAATYGAHALEMQKLLTILYAGMVAEENKDKAILKKRIKRLGIHQVLMENLSPEVAAHFSRGKRWQELHQECLARGF